MNEIFNNREIAVAIWMTIFIFWTLKKCDTLDPFKAVITAFLQKTILYSFFVMVLYISIIIYLLQEIGLWDISQLKTTIYWFFLSASVSLININSISKDPHYFKHSLLKHIEIVVVIEFLVNLYTFNLFVELILVPVLTLLIILQAFSQNKKEYVDVSKIFDLVISFIGILLLIYCTYKLASNISDFTKLQTLLDFITPIILSVLLLPFIFVISVYSEYEKIVCRLYTCTDNKKYLSHAAILALIYFKLDYQKINMWLFSAERTDFDSLQNIRSSIKSYDKTYK